MTESGNRPSKPITAALGESTHDLPEIEVGTMVGEYRIEGQLGEGGMGRVYAAIHPVIAKRAAIKILHPELSANREAVERFIQEARAVNQIGHPNIVDIFAFGQLPDGRSYFVMEWLRGESLGERTDRAPLPMVEAISILETVSLALEAAHETGIVHRDLKPDNIFLVDIKTAQPQVKLLDFGIAKLLNTDAARTERTRTGNLLGTPAYISPEQARGYTVDHRTDIYAFGALAYELFTGALPFPADNLADMIAKQLFEPPPSARLKCPDLTPELDELIQAMMAKVPEARPTLADAREGLRTFRAQVAYNMLGGQSTFDPVGGRTEPDVGLAIRNQFYQTPPPGSLRLPTGALATPTPPPGSVRLPTGALATPPGPPSMPMRAATATTQSGGPSEEPAAPPRSRRMVVVISALAALAAGIAVFLAVGSKGHDAEPAKVTAPASDPPKADPPKPDPPKVDPPKADPPKVAADPPKVDPVVDPKVDPPKVASDPPKADPPKADPPRIDPQRQKTLKRPGQPPKVKPVKPADDDAPL